MADQKTVAPSRRSKVDTSKMSPEELAAYNKRREAMNAPKPAYIVYTIDGNGKLNITKSTRSADEVMEAFQADPSVQFARFEIK